ncbi:XPG N-terminal domain protein [Cryptosporidium meleagridis]|uniref:XPG N-terminal domain protein n=1 Tax=Cryptosporidium meleagridis TaxID=93969 RepID=A0A2P4Z0X6_9CRYT|nr:XPG N-terminal domain protein [Cryptosporidium meleagridis]
MGVKGLWDIVAPSGIRIKPETLEGQILAIDASIWLKQFLMGLKDKEGKIPQGAHLLGFFKRLCKLLYYGILPVIVFDGAPPEIKKRTLELRRMQREMSEINMRRVANKLLLNTIRLRVAKKVKDKVRKRKDKKLSDEEYKNKIDNFDVEEEKEEQVKELEESESGEINQLYTINDKNKVENKRKAHSIEEKISLTPKLFSSEDENNITDDDEDLYNRPNRKFKKYGKYQQAHHLMNETNENSEAPTSYFPVMGFLSERRRLDEMPEIDTNLFSMPIQISSSQKIASKKMTKIEDLNAFLRVTESSSDERRLMDLPLDTEIDPQVFEQLNSKLQYEILIQLRDAWINALRSNAVDTKDNMSQFSNSQIECYLRYLRINQEIEKLKARMAKECEEEQMESANEEIEVVEYGQIYDPDNNDFNNNIQDCSSSSLFEDQSKETVNEELLNIDDSTLTGKIINFSKKIGIDNKDIDTFNHNEALLSSDILSMKGYHNLSKITKKERIKFLQTTDYTKNDNIVSNPLNTPLFELEKLLNNENIQEGRIQDKANNTFNDINDIERLELLKENVDELFKINNEPIQKLEEKDDGFIVDIENRVYQDEDNKRASMKDDFGNEDHDDICDDDDWQDIEWESANTILPKPQENNSDSLQFIKSIILSNDLVSNIEPKLDSILGLEKIEEKDESKQEQVTLIDSEELREQKNETYLIKDSEKHQDGFNKTEICQLEYQTQDLEPEKEQEPEHEPDQFQDQKQKPEQEIEQELEPEQEQQHQSEPEHQTEQLDYSYLEDIKEIIQKEDEKAMDMSLFSDHYAIYDKNLDEILFELEKEQEELSLEFTKHDIILNSEITKEMQYQICLLLKALGIPWIDSPGEAEAQASILTQLNICHGVLSDDSDCLIFGAKKIFRNFFSGNSVEMYDLNQVKKYLGIEKQEQFYILAILLGCDYTVGVNGIGPVNAVEVLKAYPELEDMILFQNWSMNKFQDKSTDLVNDTFERAEFKRNHSNYRHSWVFPPDFPCFDAIHAMKNPNIISNFKPTFGKIDKNSTIELITNNTNLTHEKVSLIIDPIIKNQNNKYKQTKIHEFLIQNQSIKLNNHHIQKEEKVASIISKRMKKALNHLK